MILSSDESLSVCDIQNRLILPSGEKKREGIGTRKRKENANALVVNKKNLLQFKSFNCLVKITL